MLLHINRLQCHVNITFFFKCLFTLFFKRERYLFTYLFWLCWVFVSVQGLSLVAASGGHSSSQCVGLSLSRPLLLRSTGSRCAGSVVVAHGPSCSAACGIFPDQGSNPCPLHWQADSQPLRHQRSPKHNFYTHWETKKFTRVALLQYMHTLEILRVQCQTTAVKQIWVMHCILFRDEETKAQSDSKGPVEGLQG